MKDIVNVKLRALDRRHEVEHVVTLFEGFQNYIEHLDRALKGEISEAAFLRVASAYELRIEEQSYRFREWSGGERILNRAVFTLIRRPDKYSEELLILATVKFEHLLEKAKNDLQEIHEELALLTNEAEAAVVTYFQPQDASTTTQKVKVADQVLDIAFKWGTRVVQIAPWLDRMLQHFRS